MIYVDQIQKYEHIKEAQARRLGPGWCHLFADTDEELHEFASLLGMKREWFQEHDVASHYDITPNRRAAAIEQGATQITTKNYIRLMRKKNE